MKSWIPEPLINAISVNKKIWHPVSGSTFEVFIALVLAK